MTANQQPAATALEDLLKKPQNKLSPIELAIRYTWTSKQEAAAAEFSQLQSDLAAARAERDYDHNLNAAIVAQNTKLKQERDELREAAKNYMNVAEAVEHHEHCVFCGVETSIVDHEDNCKFRVAENELQSALRPQEPK